MVCVFVCRYVCVGHTGELCENDWTDQDAVYGTHVGSRKEPCIKRGQDPPREGVILGVVTKVFAALYAAK